MAFVPEIAHPIYSPFGGAGLPKSMWQTMIKRIVDPAVVDLLTIPTDKNEFLQHLGHNYMTFYDNLKQKRVPSWLPQDICRAQLREQVISNGHSSQTMTTLHANTNAVLGFNGINVAMTEADVASRSITVKMETIPKELNRPESEVYSEFEALKPSLLGFIFDTISKVLTIIDSINSLIYQGLGTLRSGVKQLPEF